MIAERPSAPPRDPASSPAEPRPASHPAHGPEESLRLRLAVLTNTIVAFVAYGAIDPDTLLVFPIAVVCAGAAFSHWRRGHRNIALKFLLAIGMLWALWEALGNLVRGTIDPRLALAQLLFWLQVLNSFDLPRRRNLRVAVLVAAVLMVVTGTLSRTIDYGGLLILFGATLAWASYEAFAAEAGARPAAAPRTAAVVGGVVVAVAIVATPMFMLAPRKERTLTGATLPLSINIPLPENLDPRVRAMGLGRGGGDSTGTTTRKPNLGTFAEELDLNTRGAPSEEVVMRVQTDRPEYWRAIAYDRYDGQTWSMLRKDEVTAFNVANPPMRINRPEGQGMGELLTHTIYIERDQSNLIYSAWTPTTVYFPTGLIWRDAYGSLRSPIALEKDMIYSILSEVPILNRRALARAAPQPVPPHLAPYLALPKLSKRVLDAAKKARGDARSTFSIMANLRDHLALGYPYDLNVPAAPAGAECVDHFLFEQKAGFCQQFATALAVLGRANGVPTRLVTGFVPGDYNPFTGLWEVKGKHAHAWVEAYLPGPGWVPFDATPSTWLPDFGEQNAAPGAVMAWAVLGYLKPHMYKLALVLGGVGVGALALAGAAWLDARRRDPAGPATRAYRRLRRRLVKRGVPDNATDTPREWLATVAAAPEAARALPELTAFVARYEAARFGGSDAAAEAEAVALARRAEEALAGKRV